MDAAASLADLVRDGLVASVVWALPLVAAALAAAVGAGWLAGRFGIADPSVSMIVRAAAVLVAVLLVAGSLADATVQWGTQTWEWLPQIGQGLGELPPAEG